MRSTIGTDAGDDIVRSLRVNGYAVVPGAVPTEMCERVVDALAEVVGIHLDEPATWSRIGTELDMVPLWGHPSQWDIRQLPNLHEVWSAIWQRRDLWTDVNSCRVTPPWRPGAAEALPIHFDVDPHDLSSQWFPGLVALTDAPVGGGGFRCVPSLFRAHDRWPTTWPCAGRYEPQLGSADEIVEVPLRRGDVLIWDSHLPHGTVPNLSGSPRAVFYLQLHPPGTAVDLAERLADVDAGRAPPWVRWKPGHDRLDRHPFELSQLGRQLLGLDPWPEPAT